MELAHAHPMAGHLGAQNTIQRIRDRFHWPGLEGEVKRFCQACPTCQRTSPRTPPPSPLIPLPIIEVPFMRIGMDLVGPLPKSARGHEHILVIVDYATRYPEAIPLRKATSKAIGQELFLLCSRVGIPSEILTDQGTPFMSRLMADLCRLLQVRQIKTTVYHPQTDGLVERFNQTLKQMLRRVAADDRRDWDKMLPYVLFGIREVPQASTGFTPFELLFGRQPRGLLDVAREAWEHQLAAHRSTLEHVREMRERIDRVMPLVREHLTKAQQAQQRHYDRAAQPQEFQPGDHVMVLVPTTACKFLATWQGPYTVTEKVGPVTYRVRQPGRRKEDQLYHINLLKHWVGTRTQLATLATSDPGVVDMNFLLSDAQKKDLHHLIGQFSDVFSPIPGWTQVLQHDIRTPPGTVLLRPHQSYAATYLDDIVVHSESWEEHLAQLRRVLLELQRAGLTANPRKCHLALFEARYLGFQVGRGLIRPQEKKVTAILSARQPTTKTQVRAFLGLAGYYRCFIPNFSSLASPLADLTRKGQPEKVPWGPEEEEAFQRVNRRSPQSPSCEPQTLVVPSWCKPMRPTPGWGLSSHRCRMERNTRWSTSAESCPLRNNAMPRSRRRRWPLSGQSWSSGTTSSAVNSPSLLTMPLYSGWPGRRTPTRG